VAGRAPPEHHVLPAVPGGLGQSPLSRAARL